MSDNNKPLYKDPDVLERLYWYEGMSQKEIGNKLDCSATTVSKYMDKFGIETRDPSIKLNGGENAVQKQIEDYLNSRDNNKEDDLEIEKVNETVGIDDEDKEVRSKMDNYYIVILLIVILVGLGIASLLL